MLSEVPCGAIANYSPRGSNQKSIKSRHLLGQIKNANPSTLKKICDYLNLPKSQKIRSDFFDNRVLIPVPRSSLLLQNALWPTKLICNEFIKNNLGTSVDPCLKRIINVNRSSSFSSADSRPSVDDHYKSINGTPNVYTPVDVTLIDDVLTLGRTTFACALRIHEIYPNASIKVFSLMRTEGLVAKIDQIENPRQGKISFNNISGKTKVTI